MKLLLKIFIALIAFSFAAGAADLSRYRGNVRQIKEDISSLLETEAGRSAEEEQKLIDRIYERLPALFPPKQTVELPDGGSVEADNEWLINKFASFKDLEPDAPERRQILAEIYERLDAVEQKIIELETAALSGRTKDEEKQKLAEILRREQYARPDKQGQDESAIAAAYRRFAEWLKSLFPERKPQAPTAPDGFQAIPFFLQLVIYGFAIALIGFLVYKFAPLLITRFQTRDKRERRERVILGERIAAGETPDDLFGEAERMAGAGDLRGAIRKGYIALLCELADRKIIGLSKNKTNRDYLRDVRRRDELYRNMSGLTNNYERHWYGSETADEADWKEFKNGYRKAVGGGGRTESG